jgi:site-specific recombinase XerD
LLSFIYYKGLRLNEVRNIKICDVDCDRIIIHIKQTKYNKDRYVPLSPLISKGFKKYIEAYNPKVYLFNGRTIGSQLSDKGVQWPMRECVKRSGIKKQASMHTLRHSYATHLLEQGMDIDTLSKLLGHSHLSTTMVYLHVARLGVSKTFSPFDGIYKKK